MPKTEPQKVGRKTVYQEDWPQRAKHMAEQGLAIMDIAVAFGITRQSFLRLRKQHPELEESLREGLRAINRKVEDILLKKAMGYVVEEQMTEVREVEGVATKHIRKTTKDIAPDFSAIRFWLMNRDPERWPDTQRNINADIPPESTEDVESEADLLAFLDKAGFTPKSDELSKLHAEPIPEDEDNGSTEE